MTNRSGGSRRQAAGWALVGATWVAAGVLAFGTLATRADAGGCDMVATTKTCPGGQSFRWEPGRT